MAFVDPEQIIYPSTTELIDNLTDAGGLTAVRGTSLVSLPFNGSTPQQVTVLPGASVFANGSATVSNLTVEPGGTYRLAESGTSLLTVGTLDLEAPDTAGDNGGVLDLSDNDMIVRQTDVSVIEPLLAAGYDGGLWDGASSTTGPQPAAIVSSAAAADTYQIHALRYQQVGTASGDAVAALGFAGATISAGDVVIGYTFYGDANLDATVDGSDTSALDNGYNFGLTGWGNGDFTYSGAVSTIDGVIQTLGAYYAELDSEAADDPVVGLPAQTAQYGHNSNLTVPANTIPSSQGSQHVAIHDIVWHPASKKGSPGGGPAVHYPPSDSGINVNSPSNGSGPVDKTGSNWTFPLNVGSGVAEGTYVVLLDVYNDDQQIIGHASIVITVQ